MLLSKKLLLADKNPYVFIFPFVTSGGRRQTFTDYYITKDGSGITAGSFPVSRVWFRPVYFRGQYVTVSYENNTAEIYTSGDAQTWTLATTLSGFNPAQMLIADDWVYMFASSGPIYRAQNLTTWSSVGTCPIGITSAQGCVAYRNNVFVAAHSENFAAEIYRSVDGGATWSLSATQPGYAPQYGTVPCYGVHAVEGGFVVEYGNQGTRPGTNTTINGGSYRFFYSADGDIWDTNPVFTLTAPEHLHTRLCSNGKIAYFIATGYTNASGYMSTDGTTWEPFQFTAQTWRNCNTSSNKRYLISSSWYNNDLTLSTVDINAGTTSMALFNNIPIVYEVANQATW